MQTLKKVSFLCFILAQFCAAAQYDVSCKTASNHNNWGTGWDSVYVIKNDLVTVAVVPKIGGRVMQYDLGTHPSIYVHEENKGKTITDGNAMIGGFRMLPSPQADFGWPSPPKVDYGAYTCTVISNTADSAVLSLLSPVENSTDSKYSKHQGLQFKRVITMYKASSHVKVEMTMYNKGTQSFTHGIWDITQSACQHNNTADLTNFWVYFQRNPSSTLGSNKGYVQYDNEGTEGGSQWKPDAAPGKIMGIQYQQKIGKVGADCKAGWICFADLLDKYAFVKTFKYEEGKTYPDSGASVQTYTYKDYNMLEVEVLGPLTTLAPGDSVKMVEDWFAARTSGPVLAVSNSGLITKKLTSVQTSDTLTVNGTFGIFHKGTVKYQFCNASKSVISTPDSVSVIPTDSLAVGIKLVIPPGATMLQLSAFDSKGNLIGSLDSTTVPTPVSLSGNHMSKGPMQSFSAFRKNNSIEINVPYNGNFRVTLLTIDGKQIATFAAKAPYHYTAPIISTSDNVLLINISGNGLCESKKLFLTGKN